MKRQRGLRKELVGTVLRKSMEKTVVVEVRRMTLHPKYKKYIRRKKKYLAHNLQKELNIGDKVIIQATRPISKRKTWKVYKIVERAKMVEAN